MGYALPRPRACTPSSPRAIGRALKTSPAPIWFCLHWAPPCTRCCRAPPLWWATRCWEFEKYAAGSMPYEIMDDDRSTTGGSMSTREKTMSECMIEGQLRFPGAIGDFTALLRHVRLACNRISFIVCRGELAG